MRGAVDFVATTDRCESHVEECLRPCRCEGIPSLPGTARFRPNRHRHGRGAPVSGSIAQSLGLNGGPNCDRRRSRIAPRLQTTGGRVDASGKPGWNARCLATAVSAGTRFQAHRAGRAARLDLRRLQKVLGRRLPAWDRRNPPMAGLPLKAQNPPLPPWARPGIWPRRGPMLRPGLDQCRRRAWKRPGPPTHQPLKSAAQRGRSSA